MATVPAGTIFSAIKPGTNVDKRSALINRNTLEYTIEDIASSVSGDIDLTEYLKIVDAASTYLKLTSAQSTYQPKFTKFINSTQIDISNSVAANTIQYGGGFDAGAAKSGTFTVQFLGGSAVWNSTGAYSIEVLASSVLPSFGSVINISVDFYGLSKSIIPQLNVYQAGGGFLVLLRNIGTNTSILTAMVVNWSII
jgi:hypothetical protein